MSEYKAIAAIRISIYYYNAENSFVGLQFSNQKVDGNSGSYVADKSA